MLAHLDDCEDVGAVEVLAGGHGVVPGPGVEAADGRGAHDAELRHLAGELHPRAHLRLGRGGEQAGAELHGGAPAPSTWAPGHLDTWLPDVRHEDGDAVAPVVGGVAGVAAAVRGPRVVDAESVLQRGVPHGLLGPALQVGPGRGVGEGPARGPVHLQTQPTIITLSNFK